MVPIHNCCSCIKPYDRDRSFRHALCLPCGHSICRSCLLELPTLNCPVCHEPFQINIATMAPNYMLHDVLAASPASAASGVTQPAVVYEMVAVLYHGSIQRNNQAVATRAEMRQMHLLLQGICGEVQPPPPPQRHQQQQQRQLNHLDQQLIPMQVMQQSSQQSARQMFGWPPLPIPSHTAALTDPSRSFRFTASSSFFPSNRSSSNRATPTVSNRVVYMGRVSLEALAAVINTSTVPTTFDLGGRTLCREDWGLPASSIQQPAVSILLTANNITLQNGTIFLSKKPDRSVPGLHVCGRNVRLKRLSFMGGEWGVLVLPGGSAQIIGCEVIGSCSGLGVGDFGVDGVRGNSSLELDSVTVSYCAGHGLTVGIGGFAKVHSCGFLDNGRHGMWVSGDSDSILFASSVTCHGNNKRGLSVGYQGRAILYNCNLSKNTKGSVFVQDPKSVINHSHCVLDQRADAVYGGKII